MLGIVYFLQSDDGRFYIGSTTDIERRFDQHQNGQTPTTHRFKNPKLVFTQEFPNLQKARQIELRLKKLKRKDYIEKIIRDGFIKMN